MRGRGVEVAAAGVLDAGVVGKGCGFGASCDFDALGGWHLVDVVEVEVKVTRELAELVCLGESCEGVFAGDLGEGDGAVDETGDALGGEVGGGCAGCSLADENASPTAREPDSFKVSTWPWR